MQCDDNSSHDSSVSDDILSIFQIKKFKVLKSKYCWISYVKEPGN